MKDYGFVVIGAGNLGSQLSFSLKRAGLQPKLVINRSQEKGERLAKILGCDFSFDYKIPDKTVLTFICTSDDSIPEVLEKIEPGKSPVLHCSGSTSMDVFGDTFDKYGVFYPLQTFSANVEVDFRKVPILLEASDKQLMKLLMKIAITLSDRVFPTDSETRLNCHISAVFAANFSNHLIGLGETLLEKSGLHREILHPLLDEMIKKLKKYGTFLSQTGPAMRNDQRILKKHLESLEGDPYLHELYRIISDRIAKDYNDLEINE
jgi:predicted short-subunit dehydrogenase-like oxidoreductase (DUF2520 family)